MDSSIERTNFVLAVPDVTATANHFHDVLGFEVLDMGDDGWRMLVRDNARIMIGECPNAIPPADLGDHSYFGYLVVTGVDALYAEFDRAGAQLLSTPTTEPWGMREFGLRTPDGHRMMFGEPQDA